MDNYQRIFRARPSRYRLIHYEAEVYKLVYGRDPLSDLQLNYRRPKKEYKGLYWDHMIDEEVIDGLLRLSNFDIVEVNQGKDSKLLTHLIIRTHNQSPDYIESVVNKLNHGDTKAKFGTGIGDKVIIYIATKNWFRYDANNANFHKWWKSIPQRLNSALR